MKSKLVSRKLLILMLLVVSSMSYFTPKAELYSKFTNYLAQQEQASQGSTIVGTTIKPSKRSSLKHKGNSSTHALKIAPAASVTTTINIVGNTVTETITILRSSTNPSVFGQSVTFTAFVSDEGRRGTHTASVTSAPGIPTGTVTFKDGSTTLGTGTLDGTGTATFSTSSALSPTTHSITAMYDGDTNFSSSTSTPVSQVVNQATVTTLAASPTASVFGQSVTFTASVTGGRGRQNLSAGSPTTFVGGGSTLTETVTFMDGSTILGTGTLDGARMATLSTSTLSAGTHSITATYSGNTRFAGSTSKVVSFTVSQASTTTTLMTSGSPAKFSSSVTFTATVAPVSPGAGIATGTVAFFDGSTMLGTGTLSNGVTTFTTSSLTPGNHSITAVYSGDSNFNGSTSAVILQFVSGVDHNTLYVADMLNNRIQCSTNDGTTWQFIGNGAGTGLGQFNQPQGISTNLADTLIFVADTGNNRIQRSTNGGSTWQAIATAGTATNKVNAPQAVAYDEFTDILYIADTLNSRILKVLAASTASPSFSLMASNGVAVGQVSQPQGIAVDSNGFVYIADTTNNRVQMFNGSWSVLAAAGTTVGKVARPAGVYVNNNGVVFIADTGNNRIQTISKGTPTVFMSAGTAVGTVNVPQGITFTNSGNAFIADTGNNRVQKKNFSSGVSTVVGAAGTTVGKFNQPTGIR